MPLTDEERERLSRLTNEELIDLYDNEREKARANSAKARKERQKIIKAFREDDDEEEKAEENLPEERDYTKNELFKKLKNRYK